MEATRKNNYFLIQFHLASMNWIFTIVVPTMHVPLWSHFSDKSRHLSSTNQYACPTSILSYLRVLPPGISRIL
jgi:hypothetical protein